MARNQARQNSTWIGFFNYYLTEEEKAAIRVLVDGKKKPALADVLSSFLKQNYKTSLSVNESAGTFVCSITGKTGNPNRGYTYSVSHVDFEVAIYAMWFVASEVFQWGQWPVDEIDTPNW